MYTTRGWYPPQRICIFCILNNSIGNILMFTNQTEISVKQNRGMCPGFVYLNQIFWRKSGCVVVIVFIQQAFHKLPGFTIGKPAIIRNNYLDIQLVFVLFLQFCQFAM